MYTVSLILQTLIWIPTRVYLKIVRRYKVLGADWRAISAAKGPKRGVLLVSNHIGQSDPVLLAAAFPLFSRLRPLFYVSLDASGYRHLPLGFLFGGFLFRIWGAYPAYRGTGNYGHSFMHHIRILSAGKTVCIFPEGGLAKPGAPRAVKPGVAHLAEIAQPLILPAYVSRTRGRVTVTFGKPFEPAGQTAEEIFAHVNALSNHAA